jgi:hypothetical protein
VAATCTSGGELRERQARVPNHRPACCSCAPNALRARSKSLRQSEGQAVRIGRWRRLRCYAYGAKDRPGSLQPPPPRTRPGQDARVGHLALVAGLVPGHSPKRHGGSPRRPTRSPTAVRRQFGALGGATYPAAEAQTVKREYGESGQCSKCCTDAVRPGQELAPSRLPATGGHPVDAPAAP